MFKKIRQFMARSGGAPLFDVVTQQFGSIDRRALEVEIDLKARARKQGKANLPPPEQRDKDSLATDIDTHLAQVVREGREQLKNYLESLRHADNTVRPWDAHITERDTAFKSALTRLFETAKNGVNELYEERGRLADSEHAFQQFRTERNINRPVDQATDPQRTRAWLVFILVGEAIFNAFALGGAHREGFFGALPETLVIALVNVCFLGGLLGYGARTFNRGGYGASVIGGVIVLAVVAVAMTFNFLIAHYRDTLLSLQTYTGDVTDYIVAYTSMFRDTLAEAFSAKWFAFDSMMSFLLLPVGFGLCIFAAIKWRHIGDPYTRLAHAKEERVREYARISRIEYARIGETADKAIKKISGMHDMATAALHNVESHKYTCRSLCEKYVTWVSGVNEVGKALYAQYREINMQHRETNTMPKAFELPFNLPADLVSPPGLPVQPPPVTEGQIAAQRKRVEAQNALVTRAHNRYLEIYKTIGELAPDKVAPPPPFDDEVARVNADLQAQADKIT